MTKKSTKQTKPVSWKPFKRRKKGVAKQKPYFTADTEAEIIAFQKSESLSEKNRIFTKHIYPAFKQLILVQQNQIHNNVMDKNDVFAETMAFLFSKIDQFDASKGSKAFSFFSVVARNFVLGRAIESKKESDNLSSIDDPNTCLAAQSHAFNQNLFTTIDEDTKYEIDALESFKEIFSYVDSVELCENESKVVDAVKILLEDTNKIYILTADGILEYLSTITGLNTKTLLDTIEILHHRCA